MRQADAGFVNNLWYNPIYFRRLGRDTKKGYIMDASWLYPATIVVLLILAYMQWQTNSKKMMVLVLIILGYIIYSHETGYTLTELREEAVDDFDEAVGNSKYKERVISPQMRPVEAQEMFDSAGSEEENEEE